MLSAATTSGMMFLSSVDAPLGKHSAQFGVNWCLQLPKHVDQVGCVDNSSLTLPWDSGKLLCLENWFAHPTDRQLRPSPFDKLHQLSAELHQLWDTGGSSHRPAWGQAGFQGEGNVTDWALDRTEDVLGWAAGGSRLQVGPRQDKGQYKRSSVPERKGKRTDV